MNSVNTIEVPPRAGALTQSMRGMGYTLQTAVADIIDNSIAAGAETICLRIDRTKGDVVQRLVISDDGCGMNRAELILAMSLGLRFFRRSSDQDLKASDRSQSGRDFSCPCRRLHRRQRLALQTSRFPIPEDFC